MARKKTRKIKLSRVIFLVFILYIGFTLWNQRKLAKKLGDRRQTITAENQELQKEIDQMNKEIEESDSLQFVEKIAREELGMVKPREIIYIDRDKPKKAFLKFKKEDN